MNVEFRLGKGSLIVSEAMCFVISVEYCAMTLNLLTKVYIIVNMPLPEEEFEELITQHSDSLPSLSSYLSYWVPIKSLCR